MVRKTVLLHTIMASVGWALWSPGPHAHAQGWSRTQDDVPTTGTSEPPEGMRIGPIAGFTTSWHNMPARIAVPLRYKIPLKQAIPPGHTVRWSGANEIGQTIAESNALFYARSPGVHVVRAHVELPAGPAHDAVALIEVIDVKPDDISFGPPVLHIDGSDLDEQSSNLETMAAYFGPSVAGLHVLGTEHFATSIDRPLHMEVSASPAAFATLAEWRVNGTALSLGQSVSLSFSQRNHYTVVSGPPGSTAALTFEIYAAQITSHVSDSDIVPEQRTLVFEAHTDPPGFEGMLTWLSSTKYGHASPVLGEGPQFEVQFNDTWGSLPGYAGGQFQWLGVRCDNDRFNQDQKTGACCLQDGCVEDLTDDDCVASGGAYQGDGSACEAVTCPTREGGACCLNGACLDNYTVEACDAAGGDHNGPGSDCADVPCTSPGGACCTKSGCLEAVTPAECKIAGGSYQGPATICDPQLCPRLSGACCIDGVCSESTFAACTEAGGDYQGDGSTCPNVMCFVALGACCVGTVCNADLSAADCDAAAGQFLGPDSTCSVDACGVASAIVISEVRGDQPGADDDEYFEISAAAGTSLDGVSYLVIGDGTGGSGVIEVVVDLSGLAVPADGVFLAAERSFSIDGVIPDLSLSLNFENSDNYTHVLVRDFSGAAGDDLDLDDDCTLDAAPWAELLDIIALAENTDLPPAGTECHYGPPVVGPDGDAVPAHAVRCPDGSWRIGDADPAAGDDTPGAANTCA